MVCLNDRGGAGCHLCELDKQDKATVVAKRKGRRCLSPALIVLGVDQERRALAGSPTEKQWN